VFQMCKYVEYMKRGLRKNGRTAGKKKTELNESSPYVHPVLYLYVKSLAFRSSLCSLR
jgi:hypothetical protein